MLSHSYLLSCFNICISREESKRNLRCFVTGNWQEAGRLKGWMSFVFLQLHGGRPHRIFCAAQKAIRCCAALLNCHMINTHTFKLRNTCSHYPDRETAVLSLTQVLRMDERSPSLGVGPPTPDRPPATLSVVKLASDHPESDIWYLSM